MSKPFTMIAVGIFTFVALAHLCRLYQGWDIVIAGWTVPMWASILGAIVPGALAYLLWHENKARPT
jgi:uncharacterized membrane protein YvlD (DUF360 family)